MGWKSLDGEAKVERRNNSVSLTPVVKSLVHSQGLASLNQSHLLELPDSRTLTMAKTEELASKLLPAPQLFLYIHPTSKLETSSSTTLQSKHLSPFRSQTTLSFSCSKPQSSHQQKSPSLHQQFVRHQWSQDATSSR